MDNMGDMEDMENIACLGHPNCISHTSGTKRTVAQELIELIDFDEAPVYQTSKTLKTALNIPHGNRKAQKKFYKTSFRLDFQGLDNDKTFGRYAIQYKNETFAQIHLKINQELGVKRIREAFKESLNTFNDIWLEN
jgi:hypothetical protein